MKHTNGKWKLCIHSDEPFTESEKNIYSKAHEMYEALKNIAEKLDDQPMNINSKEFRLWKIANDALKGIES